MSQQQLDKLVSVLRARDRPQPYEPGPMRAQMEELGVRFRPPDDAVVERAFVSGIGAEWVAAPAASSDLAILYLHGGGYVQGSPATHRNLAYFLSRSSGARVLLLDYRLAPEHPFPAPVIDAVLAWRWLLAAGYKPGKMAIVGDSAGGGLAVAAQVQIRNEGLALPAASVCISPWVDMQGIGETMQSKAGEDPMVSQEVLAWMAEQYLGGADPQAPLASPMYADLTGLPPMLIQVGTAEVLLDDARRLTARAQADGVQVTLKEWRDMVHVWHLFQPMLSEGEDGLAEAGGWVAQHVA